MPGTVLSTMLRCGLATAALYLNWYALNETIDVSAVDAASSPSAVVATRNVDGSMKVVVVDDFKDTLDRPLFSPNRRPPGAEAPPVVAAEPAAIIRQPALKSDPVVNLRLLGTMRSGPERRRALIQLEGSSQGVWVDEGATVGTWKINEIHDDRVTIVAAGVATVLGLYPSKSSSFAQP